MISKFLDSIHNKKIVEIKIDSKEKGVIIRTCIPFDFAPSKRYKDNLDRYHFYDLDSPAGNHNLSILPEQLIEIKILDECFDPADYITWKANWCITRDWGIFS